MIIGLAIILLIAAGILYWNLVSGYLLAYLGYIVVGFVILFVILWFMRKEQ